MPAPASQPTWATDANFTNGGAGIAGTATKVAPSGAIQAEGHVPGTPAPAQRVNWWKNLVGQWTTWLEAERARLAGYIGGADGTGEWVYDAVRVRILPIHLLGRIQSGQSKIVGGAAAGVLTQGQSLNDGWRIHEASLFGGGPGGTDTYSPGHYVRTGLPQHIGYIPLDDVLRTGMTIKSVFVPVDPGTAQATVSDRMKFVLTKRAYAGFAAPSTVASGNADNTANQQTMQQTGLAEVVDKTTYTYGLYVWSSAGADSTPDDLYTPSIAVDDPGPRNY